MVDLFVDYLRVPNLRDLSLHTGGEGWDDADDSGDWGAFMDCVNEFSDSLQSLALYGPTMTAERYRTLLSSTPKLVELKIVNASFGVDWADLFDFLTPGSNNDHLTYLAKLHLERPTQLSARKGQTIRSNRSPLAYIGSYDWAYKELWAIVLCRGIRARRKVQTNPPFSPLEKLVLLHTDLIRMQELNPLSYASLCQRTSEGLHVETILDDPGDARGYISESSS